MADIGECIYCGVTKDLRDEHVVPFALGGHLVLKNASCRSCEQITTRFERKVLRGFMYRARNTARFPTRRRKERPATSTVTYKDDTGTKDVVGPVENDPAFLQLPLLAEPGYFRGDLTTTGVTVRGAATLYFGPHPHDAIKRAGASQIVQRDDLDVTSFARMLGKIGYCTIVGTFGVQPRDEVAVLPFILGRSDDGSKWIGSASFSSDFDRMGALHTLSHRVYRKDDDRTHEVLVARVKLFASAGAPGYEIIVRHSAPSLSQ